MPAGDTLGVQYSSRPNSNVRKTDDTTKSISPSILESFCCRVCWHLCDHDFQAHRSAGFDWFWRSPISLQTHVAAVARKVRLADHAQRRGRSREQLVCDPRRQGEVEGSSSIFVFDPNGKFIRAFGQQFQGGGHGIEVRVEDGTPYLYIAAYQQVKTISKLTLTGEKVWEKFAPMKSGVYADGEDTNPQRSWGRDRFMPTNFAFLPNGDFLLADGYGAFQIHHYDKDGNWKSCFGGPGAGEGKFATPHGIWIDDRAGKEAEIVVADRAHGTLQVFDLNSQYKKTVTGFGLPANVDTYKDLMLVPELVARVSILDQNFKTIATIGDDRKRLQSDKKKDIRKDSSRWQNGKFVHPHDACFDKNGDIFVAEWVSTGRISKLTRA